MLKLVVGILYLYFLLYKIHYFRSQCCSLHFNSQPECMAGGQNVSLSISHKYVVLTPILMSDKYLTSNHYMAYSSR